MNEPFSERRDVERALRRRIDKLEDRVEELMREVYELTRKLARIEQQERRRVAKLLHDEIQQRIYGIGLHVGLARQNARSGKADMVLKELATVETWLGESTNILRKLALDLSPPAIHEEGLVRLLVQLAEHMNETHGLNVEVRSDHRFETEPEVRVLLFQAVYELLFNVVKHARVRFATVDLRTVASQVEVRVIDDGAGFNSDAAVSRDEIDPGGGLLGLRERLGAVGGSIEIDSAPAKGTRITVRMPLAASAP